MRTSRDIRSGAPASASAETGDGARGGGGARDGVDGDARAKRQKLAAETLGPLDEVFGQRSAFGLERDDSDAMRYLASVRREAENDQCVHFVAAEPRRRPVADEAPVAPPHGALAQWQDRLVDSFLALKEELQTQLARHDSGPPPVLPQTAAAWRQHVFGGAAPTTAVVFAMNHATAIKLLIYTTQWLSANTPDNVSRWIYMLFLRIDNLLDRSECAIVRDLAKKAARLRGSPNLTPMSRYTVDMVLCIVARYYRQLDLLPLAP